MKKVILILAASLTLIAPSYALEPAHQAAIEKLFVAMHMEDQFNTSMIAGFESALGGVVDQIPAEQKDKFSAAMEKVKNFMKAEMGWDKMKDEMAAVYAKELTVEEITAVLPLMEKPEFQNLVLKQLKILPEAAKLGADRAQALQPQIMQMMQAEMSK